MNKLHEAARQALETIEDLTKDRLFTAEWAGKHGATIANLRAALSAPQAGPVGEAVQALGNFQCCATPNGVTGAIINGRIHADRLEQYGFDCEAGPLTMCADWVEFRRCFEWLAEHAAPQPAAPAPERVPLTDEQLAELVQQNAGYCQDGFSAVVRATERHHGITPKEPT